MNPVKKRGEYFTWVIFEGRNCPFPYDKYSSPFFKFDDRIWRLDCHFENINETHWYIVTLTNYCDPDPSISVELGFKLKVGNVLLSAVPTDPGKVFSAKTIELNYLSAKSFEEDRAMVLCKIVTQNTSIEKLSLDLKQMHLSGHGSDVVLRVGQKDFKAHRIILAARSPVFSAMFTHNMRENSSGVVVIEDNDSNTFSEFLHYLYTGKVENMTPENVPTLFITADKYQVSELKDQCLGFMITNITEQSICDFLNLALRHGEQELVAAANSFLSKQKKSP